MNLAVWAKSYIFAVIIKTKDMRKLIVKFFALDYVVKIGTKSINFVRAANILFPLFCLNGVLVVNGGYSFDSIFKIISFLILLIAVYFGFFYFGSNPVMFKELDDSQKWQYGSKNMEQMEFNEMQEWNNLDLQKETKIYSPLWVALINPIILIATILFSIIN